VVADRVVHTVVADPIEGMVVADRVVHTVVADPIERMAVSHTVVDRHSYIVAAEMGLACSCASFPVLIMYFYGKSIHFKLYKLVLLKSILLLVVFNHDSILFLTESGALLLPTLFQLE